MQPPHDALPWPSIDRDELECTADQLRHLSGLLDSDIATWTLRPVEWIGRSATAQRDSLESLRRAGATLPGQVLAAAGTIDRLRAEVQDAQRRIQILADSVHAAEAVARDRWSEAEGATRRAAARVFGVDPDASAETERIQQRAVVARHRAQAASREADFIRHRAVDTAEDVIAALDARDIATANHLDQLVGPLLLRPLSGSNRFNDPLSDQPARIAAALSDTRTAIQRHVGYLSDAIDRIESVPWSERTWWESMALVHFTDELELHQRFLTPGRQMLEWSPEGDGRAVEVFGDLARAQHIAIVVPGIMNTIENFDAQLSSNSQNLWRESTAIHDRTAVIAWLGYDTPELLNAVSKRRAVEYESELRTFVATLPADAHVTVVAHSYGTVLAAESAARGLAADDLVVVGSPGTRLDQATDAQLEPQAQVFAGVSDTDWVVGRTGYGSLVCPEKVFGVGWLAPLRWVVSPVTGPLSWVTDSCDTDGDGDVKGLSHGINPAHEDFGAVEISTEDVDGHSSYFEGGSSSLDAIAHIVTGTHPDQH